MSAPLTCLAHLTATPGQARDDHSARSSPTHARLGRNGLSEAQGFTSYLYHGLRVQGHPEDHERPGGGYLLYLLLCSSPIREQSLL